MIVTTKISFRQYLSLLFRLTYRKPVMMFILTIGAATIAWLIIDILKVASLPEPGHYQYFTLMLIFLIQPLAIIRLIYMNYHSSNHLKERVNVKLLKNRVELEGESFTMSMDWEKLFKVVELRKWFLIYQNNFSAIIIPKKCLKKDEEEKLRETLKSVPVKTKKIN